VTDVAPKRREASSPARAHAEARERAARASAAAFDREGAPSQSVVVVVAVVAVTAASESGLSPEAGNSSQSNARELKRIRPRLESVQEFA